MSNLSVSVSADVTNLKANMAVAQEELRKLNAEAREAAKAMAEAGHAADAELRGKLQDAVAAVSATQREISKLKSELKELNESEGVGFFGKLHESVKVTGESIEDLHAKLSVFSNAFGALSELALTGFALESVFEKINEVAEQGEKLARLAEITGLSTEALSGLRVAAIETGSDFDATGRLMVKFGEAVQDAVRDPSSKAAETFAAMGIALKSSSGEVRDQGVVLEEVARKLASYEEGLSKTTLETNLFGTKVGAEFLPVLNQLGEQGFGGLIQRAKDLGVSMSGETAEQLERYKSRMADLKLVIEGVGNAFAVGLLPALDRFNQATTQSPDNISKLDNAFKQLGLTLATIPDQLAVAGLNPFESGEEGKARIRQTFPLPTDPKPAVEPVEDRPTDQKSQLIAEGGEAKKIAAPTLEPKDNSAKEYYEQQRTALNEVLATTKLTGAQLTSYELSFWRDKLAAAQQGGEAYKSATASILGEVARLNQETNRQGIESAKAALEAQKKSAEEQLKTLDAVTAGAVKGSQAEIDAAKKAADFAASSALISGEERLREQNRYNDALKEQADLVQSLADKPLATQFANQQKQSDTQLSTLGRGEQKGLLGSPEDEQKAAQQIIAIDLDALQKIEVAREALLEPLYNQDPSKATAIAQEITDSFVAAQQSAADKIQQINAKTAEEVKKDWDGVNAGIGDALAKGLTSDKKSGFGEAITGYLREKLTSGLGDAITGGLGSIEKLVGLGGTSPGGLLSSGLNAIGAGGIAKFFGFGGDAASAGGQAASTAALTTAATGLNTASVGLNTSGVSLNTAAVALNTAAISLTASAAASGGAGLIADVTKFASSFGFPAAASGGPISGLTLVGENGPELFQPGGSGQITSNANLRAALSGAPDFSGLRYSPPAALTSFGAGGGNLSQSNFSITNARGGDTHHYNFAPVNNVQTASDQEHADAISQMTNREFQRFVRSKMGR